MSSNPEWWEEDEPAAKPKAANESWWDEDAPAARPGAREPGNINLDNRKRYEHPEGGFSTVRSMSFQDRDGREVLVPTISDSGRLMSDQEAKDEYYRSGKHLGKFATIADANAYAQQLHKEQERQYALPRPPDAHPLASALNLEQPFLRPGQGMTAPPEEPMFEESDLASIFGPLPEKPRVSMPMTPEREADIESKMAALGGPLTKPADFHSGSFRDQRLGPRLSERNQRNPLQEIEVAAARPQAPIDTRPYATFGDTLAAIPPTVVGRYGLKAVGAQEMVASQDARKKFWQAMVLPDAIRRIDEFNRTVADPRDRINYDEDPYVAEMAKRAGVRPDVFTRDWPSIANMEPQELENFKEENRALIAEQDARLEGLAKERQDIAAELQRTRPHFESEWGPDAFFFDSANSVLADMVPALVAGIALGPEAGALTMGGLVLPEEFANLKNEGHDDATALFGSMARTFAEVAPEMGVLEVALKTATGKEAMRKMIGKWAEGKRGHVISTATAEAISEEITEDINVAVDKGWLNPDMTVAEALERMARAPVLGGIMGGGVGVLTSPLPEPHIDESAFQYGTPDPLPESRPPTPPGGGAPDGFNASTVANFADILAGQGGGGFAAPNLPQQSDIPMQLPINTQAGPTIDLSELAGISVPAMRFGAGPPPDAGTMPPPATTGSPASGIGGAVGPTAPSTASQRTATPPRAGAFVIQAQVEDETSTGGPATVEATPGIHGGWTLIQPNGKSIAVPPEDRRPLEEIVAEYTSKSKNPAGVSIPEESRSLSTAFQQSAPPAPSASTEPAPTSAPQAGQPVSPTQKPPAGGAASQPRTLGEAVTPKGKRKPAAPPPAQGKLFGSEGEVVNAPPAAPAPEMPIAPPAEASARPFDTERAALNEFIKAPKKFGQVKNEETHDARAVKSARDLLPKLDELESLMAQVPAEKLSPEILTSLREDIAEIGTATNVLQREDAVGFAHVSVARLIHEAKEIAAGRVPEPTSRQKQLAEEAAKAARKGKPAKKAPAAQAAPAPAAPAAAPKFKNARDEAEHWLEEYYKVIADAEAKRDAETDPKKKAELQAHIDRHREKLKKFEAEYKKLTGEAYVRSGAAAAPPTETGETDPVKKLMAGVLANAQKPETTADDGTPLGKLKASIAGNLADSGKEITQEMVDKLHEATVTINHYMTEFTALMKSKGAEGLVEMGITPEDVQKVLDAATESQNAIDYHDQVAKAQKALKAFEEFAKKAKLKPPSLTAKKPPPAPVQAPTPPEWRKGFDEFWKFWWGHTLYKYPRSIHHKIVDAGTAINAAKSKVDGAKEEDKATANAELMAEVQKGLDAIAEAERVGMIPPVAPETEAAEKEFWEKFKVMKQEDYPKTFWNILSASTRINATRQKRDAADTPAEAVSFEGEWLAALKDGIALIDAKDHPLPAQAAPTTPPAKPAEKPAPAAPASAKPLQRGEVYPQPEGPVRQNAEGETEAADSGKTLPLETTQDKFSEVINEFPALFAAPKKRTRATDHPSYGTYLSREEAARRIESWQEHAEKQGKIKRPKGNSERVILSLFDLTGNWARPFADAGYDVRVFDIQNGADIKDFSVEWFADNMPDIHTVDGILIACPCTDFASSGARWFADKDADGRTEASKELVFQALRTVEFWRPRFWVLENPVGRIESLTGLPPARYSFNPNDFGDPYTKKTLLWGKFNTDLPVAPVEPSEGSKMHAKYGGGSLRTKNARSATPEGFAASFFMANNYLDATPAERLLSQFPEAAGAVEQALAAGFTEEQIREVVTDPYENYEYAEARDALRQLVKSATKTKAAKPAKPAAEGRADQQTLEPDIDANAPIPTLAEQADALDRAADEAEEEGNTDEAESLRRYAEEVRKGNVPREETPEPVDTSKAEERDEVRRPQRRKSKRQPGPFSMTREGEIRAAPDTIWTDNNINADLMELATPKRRFDKAVELLKARFGFRDIQMDKNLPIGEAIDALKDAWIGLTNLAAVQNVNPEFMSLNGRLAMQLHREYDGALAYYMPSTKTIGMTRRNDAFAHEWAHALDHYLVETHAQDILAIKGRHLTGKTRQGGTTQTLDEQVRDAFAMLLNSMFFNADAAATYVADLEAKIKAAKTPKQKAVLQKKLDTFIAGQSKKQDIASDYYERAKAKDGPTPEDSDKGYWQRPTEMFARVYESYIAHKIAGLPADHPFVTQSARMYDENRIGWMSVPYPQAMDRGNIFAALDTLMRAMRDRSLAPTGSAPNTIEPTDTRYWRKLAPNLPPQVMQQARSVIERLKAPFQRQLAETHRADRDARARAEQEKGIRDAKLNAKGYGPTRRWFANLGMIAAGKIKAMPAMIAFTVRGVLLSLQAKHKGNTGLATLVRMFATDPGANVGIQGKVYNDEVKHWEKDYQNRFAKIIEKHGVRGFTDGELRQMRDVLVNAIPENSVSEKIRAPAADMRRFLNDMYNYNVSNGVNIGYAKNGYLPRMIDSLVVEGDLAGFRAQAQKLYKLVYPREVGTLDHVLEDPLEHPERLENLTQYVREIARTGRVLQAKAAAKALLDDAKALNKKLAELKEAAEAGEDTDQLEDEVRALGKIIYDGLRDPWAMEAANDWEMRIRGLGDKPAFAFDQLDPNSDYTKARILPAETDQIMGDYLKNDPLELITTYISHSVHRVEFGKFFGNPASANARAGTPERKLGWKLDAAMQKANEPYTAVDGSEKRMSTDDFQELQKSIELLTGRYSTNMTQKGIRWRGRIAAVLTPFIFARALWSQISEPIVVARATRDMTDILRVFYAQMQDLVSHLPIKSAKQKSAWRREMSEYFGVVADHLADQLMLQRYNLLEMNSSDRVKAQRFFHISGIHPHAMSMRRATSQIFMQRYAPKIANRALGTGPRAVLARQALAELGLDSANLELLRELQSLGDITTVQQLDKLRHLDEIRTAINRFTDGAIMDPRAIDKPRMASQPEYSYMYGILSFQFAYQRHILIATGKRISNAWKEDKAIGVATAASAAANFALLMGSQMAAYMVRAWLYGGDDWEEQKEKLAERQFGLPNWFWQSMSRSGMFGSADPLVNAMFGLKYERDLTQLMAGPTIALPLKLIQDAARAGLNDTPMNANSEYKLTELTWRAAWIWGTSKALSIAGANPLLDAAIGYGLPFLTGGRVTKWVSETGAELMSGQDYVSPETKAKAAAGNIDAMAEAESAKATNAATTDPLLNEEIPE